MSRRNPSLRPEAEAEAEVAARLERALAGGLDDGLVDVARLASRTRAGIRRAAVHRRVAVAAAAVAAVAVPVAVLGFAPGWTRADGGPAGQDAPSVTAPVTPGPRTAAPTATSSAPTTHAEPPPDQGGATAVPLARVLGSDDGREVAYLVPAAANLDARDFPRPLTQTGTPDNWRFVPTVSGQGCGTYPAALAPVAASVWVWVDGRGDPNDRLTVTLTVTGWAPGTAPRHFADVVGDSGACRWLEPPTPVAAGGISADDAWLATFGAQSSGLVRAAARAGDVIVSVEVHDPAGSDSARTLATDLVNVAVARAGSSGLLATAAAVR